MIVDAYTLVGGLTVRPEPMGFPELSVQMAKAGVGRAAVTSLRGLNADARKGNDHLFAGVAPDQRLLPLGVVGPRVSAAELPSAVESCVTSGAVGLAFHVPPNTSLASLASRRAFAEIARPGLPLVACNLVGEGLPTQLAELTSDLGCALYLAGAFYIIFEEVLAVVEEHDHVYVDPSWFPTPGAVELLVDRAGPGRVLYASGATLRPMRPTLNLVLDADVDDTVKRKILAANALRLFGLPEEADRAEAEDAPLPAVETPATPAIDVHNHFGEIPALTASTRDVDAIERYARRAGFEYSVCSSYFAYYDDMDAGNQEMLDKIEGRPRLLGSPVVNPTHLEASVRWLDMFESNDRLAHATITPDTVLDRGGSEGFMALFAEAAKRGVPVFYNGPKLGLHPAAALPNGRRVRAVRAQRQRRRPGDVQGGRAPPPGSAGDHRSRPRRGRHTAGRRHAQRVPRAVRLVPLPRRAEAGHRHRRGRPDRVRYRHGPDTARLRARNLPRRRPVARGRPVDHGGQRSSDTPNAPRRLDTRLTRG